MAEVTQLDIVSHPSPSSLTSPVALETIHLVITQHSESYPFSYLYVLCAEDCLHSGCW